MVLYNFTHPVVPLLARCYFAGATVASNLVNEDVMTKTLTKWRNESVVEDSDLTMCVVSKATAF